MGKAKKRCRVKHRKLQKLAANWRPWDYGFNLAVEREMFRKQGEFFKKYGISSLRLRAARICELLISLIDIAEGNDNALQIVKPGTCEKIEKGWRLKTTTTWKMTRYVNTKNANRFWNQSQRQIISLDEPLGLDELRQQKAWYLYNKMRFYYMQQLWD